jgi:histidine triad (HIT) family protein
MDCLFCKIAQREIDSEIIFEDKQVLAFNDIKPQAPIHKLIIPRKHIPTINDVNDEDLELLGHMIKTSRNLAQELGVSESGYRLVFNVNRGAGQAVYHIHLHLLGGRSLQWPPG